MIIRRAKSLSQGGLMLLDLVFYMALLVLVLSLMAVVFNRLLIQSGNLRRNIADIERAMKAGERWRNDIRAATGVVRTEMFEDAEAMVIPQTNGTIVYTLGNTIRRRVGESNVWEVALTGVKSARMNPEIRERASGWRWELELDTRNKNARVRPLFTFMAVPGRE